MSNVKWIKLTTDMFDNRKIKYIRTLPEGNNIVMIWVMLLTLAGRCNSGGMIFLSENIPYTSKMLADELGFEESIIALAITVLEKLGMVNSNGFEIEIANWSEYQNIEGLEKVREQARIRKQNQRDREKTQLIQKCHAMSRDSHATEEERDIDIELDKEREKRVDYQLIADMYNDTCVSFPKLTKLSESRKKAIKARLNNYSLDDIQGAFIKAEASDFLKGSNGRNWTASFDWIMKDSNMAKIIDGNYDNSKSKKVGFSEFTTKDNAAELKELTEMMINEVNNNDS